MISHSLVDDDPVEMQALRSLLHRPELRERKFGADSRLHNRLTGEPRGYQAGLGESLVEEGLELNLRDPRGRVTHLRKRTKFSQDFDPKQWIASKKGGGFQTDVELSGGLRPRVADRVGDKG